MRNLLHGDWLGHPLHPILVHVPTALWPAALVFDLLSRYGAGGNVMLRTAFYAILFGLLAALLAIPTGLADWSEIGRDKPARKIGLYHMTLNLLAVTIWAVNLGLRTGATLSADSTPPVPLALSVLGTLVLIASGYLGGRMVYGYGTYVGWMSLGKWRRIAEAGGARVPPDQEG